MKEWDVFISHASEDKESIVVPLADALRKAGIRVWLDHQEIKLGDSIRAKIDEGLARSRFGIVVLSEKSLEKNWPKNELNALMAIEEDGRKVILPVWHNINKETLIKYSPLLADLLAINTNKGITSIVKAIIEVVFSYDTDPSICYPSLSRRFIELLESQPEESKVRDFLAYHSTILRKAIGTRSNQSLIVTPQMGSYTPDFCIDNSPRTFIDRFWEIILLGLPSEPLFYKEYAIARGLRNRVDQLEKIFDFIEENSNEVQQQLSGFFRGDDYGGIIIVGRRDQLTMKERELLKEYVDHLRRPSYNYMSRGIQIRLAIGLLIALLIMNLICSGPNKHIHRSGVSGVRMFPSGNSSPLALSIFC